MNLKNAWLITWEAASYPLVVTGHIAAILSSRKSDQSIAELVEFLYVRETSTAHDMAFFANRPKSRPYTIRKTLMINKVPHGDRILCGDNPWLYARRVTNLKVERKDDSEVISWFEPINFCWQDEQRTIIDFAPEEPQKVHIRSIEEPLGGDLRHLSHLYDGTAGV